jgi:transposase
VLEDAENELPDLYRPTLNLLYGRLITIKEDMNVLNKQIATLVKQNVACDRLTRLEGVGPISSVLLYATLGTGEAFANGRQFSAYLDLTPKQYSSGGKTVLIGISRYVANKRLRAVLIQGASAHMHQLKDPKTPRERRLWALIQRAGYGRAAVALANKNARAAWALPTQGAAYDRDHGKSLVAA